MNLFKHYLCLIIICLTTIQLKGQMLTPRLLENTQVNKKFTHTFIPTELVKMYDTVRMVFIGDVMQHGAQIRSALIPNQNPDLSQSYDFSYAFKYIKPALKKANIAVANMEFPMAGPPYKGYPLFSAPSAIVTEAQNSGINLFLLANNHLLDMGKEGFRKTLEIYKEMGGKYTGAYLSEEEEKENNPAIFNINGIKIAIINFTYGTNGFPIPPPFKMNLMDSTHVKEVIQRAKEKKADLIIAAPHWGEEYQLHPSIKQQKWADMLFREGVRVIIGSHPHVPQEGKIYYKKGQKNISGGKEDKVPIIKKEIDRLVYYSMGNYISNQSIPDYSQLELMVELAVIKDNFTNSITILPPKHTFLWCFKKNEFKPDYTVIPVEEIINHKDSVCNATQYDRIVKTYNYILGKNLIKDIY